MIPEVVFPRVAVIPIGGEAVRLKPLSATTSKAMIRFLNRPLLEFIILELARQGVSTFYLGVRGYYNYVSVYDYFREGYWINTRYPYLKSSVRIRYMPLYESVGNADAVRVVLEYYDVRELFITVMGDTLFSTDLREAYKLHVERRADMTVVLMEVSDVREFGVAKLSEDYRIEAFVEKPKPEEAPSNLANTGIYIFSERIREFFESGECARMIREGRMDFGRDVIPKLIELGYKVYGYVMRSGYWFDIGTPERYLRATRYMLYNASADQLEAYEYIPGVFMQGRSETSRRLHSEICGRARAGKIAFRGRNLLGRHIKIGDGAVIEDSVIDNYTIVGENSRIVNSVVMDRVLLGRGVRVENSIIARHARVEDGAVVVNSVIGDNTTIGQGAVLVNARIWPHRRVPPGARLENFEIA